MSTKNRLRVHKVKGWARYLAFVSKIVASTFCTLLVNVCRTNEWKSWSVHKGHLGNTRKLLKQYLTSWVKERNVEKLHQKCWKIFTFWKFCGHWKEKQKIWVNITAIPRSIRMNFLLPKIRSVRMSLEVYEF